MRILFSDTHNVAEGAGATALSRLCRNGVASPASGSPSSNPTATHPLRQVLAEKGRGSDTLGNAKRQNLVTSMAGDRRGYRRDKCADQH